MDEWNAIFLLLLIVLPIVGAIACALLPSRSGNAGIIALIVSLACFGLTLPLLFGFDFEQRGFQFSSQIAPIGSFESVGFSLSFGVDSISLWLVALTTFLQPLAIVASFASIKERQKEYYAWMLVLLSVMIGVFLARDLLLFYIFFELTLVPMFFIIGIWGGSKRREAAGKFFLFTFTGSVFTLAAAIYLYSRYAKLVPASPSLDINHLISFAQSALSPTERFWVLLGFLAGFAVKVPLFPVHTWLPLAHTEAPTAGSVILAGVLLKLGTYGILRLALPIGFGMVTGTGAQQVFFPDVLQIIGVLCVIGIIYGALVAWVQQDIKKLVAYSSVSHLGFCVLGLAALNHEGVQGSVLYMINHGLSTGAMFLVIGMIYDRYHTRDIDQLSGLAKKMPVMACFFVLFVLSSIGLPGLNGFASEFLTILGAFKSPHLGIGFGVFAALGIILGAVYMLHMTARVIFGPLKTPGDEEHGHGHEHGGTEAAAGHAESGLPVDLSRREIAVLVPLAIAVIVIGVIPGKLLKTFEGPVSALVGEPDAANNTAAEAAPTGLRVAVTADVD